MEEAEPIVELLERTGRRPGRDWARAAGWRCRGLLLAARGDLEGSGRRGTRRAVEAHGRLPSLRHELARTVLALGQVQRRRGNVAPPRVMQQAARCFDECGAARWALAARAELDRRASTPAPPTN